MGSCFCLSLFLCLPPFPAKPCWKLNQNLLCAEQRGKKCLGWEKKKGASENKTLLGTDLTSSRDFFPSLERTQSVIKSGYREESLNSLENANAHKAVRADFFSLPLIPPPSSSLPPPPSPPSLCSLLF